MSLRLKDIERYLADYEMEGCVAKMQLWPHMLPVESFYPVLDCEWEVRFLEI